MTQGAVAEPCGATRQTANGVEFVCTAPAHPQSPRNHYFENPRAKLARQLGPRESNIEAYFRQMCRSMGWYTFKLAPVERGIPDRLVLLPGGDMYFVELKTREGNLSPAQRNWHEQMWERYNVQVKTFHTKDQIRAWFHTRLKHPGLTGPRTRSTTPKRQWQPDALSFDPEDFDD